jgi:proteasome lid subunit RPN8/RPN11
MRRPKFLKSQFKTIQKEANNEAKLNGHEICGLILDKGSFVELIQVKNKTKRGGGFSFYYGEVRAIRKKASLCGFEIIGTFHSHPVGLPNPGHSDLHHAMDDSIMLIFDVIGQCARLWRIKDQKAKQLAFVFVSLNSGKTRGLQQRKLLNVAKS